MDNHKKYLNDIKKQMLPHFSQKEIRWALTEIDDSRQIPPKEFAEAYLSEHSKLAKSSYRLIRRCLLFSVPVLTFLAAVMLSAEHAVMGVITLLSLFILFYSGDYCMADVFYPTKKETALFVSVQLVTLLFEAGALLYSREKAEPSGHIMFETVMSESSAPLLEKYTCSFLFVTAAIIIFCFYQYFFHYRILYTGIFIQCLGFLGSLLIQYSKPYLFCLVLSLLWEKYLLTPQIGMNK